MTTSTETELAQIAVRIDKRRDLEARDRARQRVLLRDYVAEGHTWDECQEVAQVSRTRLRDALRGD
jgi:hypothetical protein